MSKRIVILGGPGAGKGTQAALICDRYRLPHISTGDIFRKNIKDKTPVGLEALQFIEKGKLVPDDITLRLVAARLEASDCQQGYLLDGFPRTLKQAEALDAIAEIDLCLNVEVAEDELLRRLGGRRVCGDCGQTYHISTKSDVICDKCGGTLVLRDDDRPEVIVNRLKSYFVETAPVAEYYRQKGKLVTVDGGRDIDKVFADIERALS